MRGRKQRREEEPQQTYRCPDSSRQPPEIRSGLLFASQANFSPAPITFYTFSTLAPLTCSTVDREFTAGLSRLLQAQQHGGTQRPTCSVTTSVIGNGSNFSSQGGFSEIELPLFDMYSRSLAAGEI